jgi:hypothetical protein
MSALTPPSSIFDGNPAHFAYELSVAQQLKYVRDEAAFAVAYMYCLPSFEPEWAVFLMTSGRKRHFIHHAAASQQIYGTTIKTNAHIMRFESDLAADLANEIGLVFESVLENVRYPEINSVGCDGSTYHFGVSHSKKGAIAAQTWSPDRNTVPGQMVALADSMAGYTQRSADRQESSINAIRAAISWIQGHRDLA